MQADRPNQTTASAGGSADRNAAILLPDDPDAELKNESGDRYGEFGIFRHDRTDAIR